MPALLAVSNMRLPRPPLPPAMTGVMTMLPAPRPRLVRGEPVGSFPPAAAAARIAAADVRRRADTLPACWLNGGAAGMAGSGVVWTAAGSGACSAGPGEADAWTPWRPPMRLRTRKAAALKAELTSPS
eukprot:366546-Chlamydomonas_euryale.AAC.40